jgi:hypothetical protein
MIQYQPIPQLQELLETNPKLMKRLKETGMNLAIVNGNHFFARIGTAEYYEGIPSSPLNFLDNYDE